jgi:hypothetical protein
MPMRAYRRQGTAAAAAGGGWGRRAASSQEAVYWPQPLKMRHFLSLGT